MHMPKTKHTYGDTPHIIGMAALPHPHVHASSNALSLEGRDPAGYGIYYALRHFYCFAIEHMAHDHPTAARPYAHTSPILPYGQSRATLYESMALT